VAQIAQDMDAVSQHVIDIITRNAC